MKAVQASQFGDPSVLVLADLPDPSPGEGEIAVDVTHAAVGLIDIFFRQGHFKDMPWMAQPPFVPGLEVTGTVREIGSGVRGFAVGERVVSMSSGSGTGGYASVFIARAANTVSIEGLGIDPALAVAAIPNSAMAYVALTAVAHLLEGETVLVHGALGGLAAAFPGMCKQLGASRVIGTVRKSKMDVAAASKLPYDGIVDSEAMADVLAGEKFDVIIDPVGGSVRTQSLALMKPGSRLIVVGNASGDWAHQVKTNDLWGGNVAVSGFNAGAYFSAHPQSVLPALKEAVRNVAAGLAAMDVDVLSFAEAALAHRRMESRELKGRIVLVP